MVAICAALIGYVAIQGISTVFEIFDVIQEDTVPELISLGNIKALSRNLVATAFEHVLLVSSLSDNADVGKYDKFEKINSDLDQQISLLVESENTDTDFLQQDESKFAEEVSTLKDDLYSSSLELINLANKRADSQSVINQINVVSDIEKVFEQKIDDRLFREIQEFERIEGIENQLSSYTVVMILGITLVGIGATAAFSIYFSRSITVPLDKLINATTKVRKENFDVDIEVKGPTEIQELTNDFKNMIRELSKIDIMKKDFSAMITHELKTPLVPILGYVDLLLSEKFGKLNKYQHERLQRIKDNCSSMQKLVTDILDVHKLEMDQIKFDMKTNNLSLIVKNCVKQMQVEFENKGIHVEESLKPNIMCNCDKSRMEQVIVNILNNAIDFCPENGGKIGITLKNEKDRAQIIIKDNGSGISSEDIGKIFTKYYQVDTTITRKHGGSGIGLSLSKLIVDTHKGKIWAESEGIGRGSEIHIEIPCMVSTEDQI